MAAIERTLTINIRKDIMKVPRYKRAKKAVTAVRAFLQQHMKAAEGSVRIGKHLNLKIWEHGIKNPLTRLTVLAKKDDKSIVTAELPNIPVKKQKPQKISGKTAEAGKGKTAKPAAATAPATTTTSTATAATVATTQDAPLQPATAAAAKTTQTEAKI